MKKLLTIILFLIQFDAIAQKVTSIPFDEFQQKEITESKGLVVVNFWATWCAPCVKELPFFIQANEKYKDGKFKLILANLDFNSKVESNVIPFLKKNKIELDVSHISDTDPNSWINKIDSTWSGAIPATVIYQNGKKVFFREGEMTFEELDLVIGKFILK